MSKKVIYAIAVAALLFTGYSAYHAQNKQELSDILLANIEALGNSEGEDPCIRNSDSDCPGSCSYANVGKAKGKSYDVVHFCDSIDVRHTYSYEKCYANGHGVMEGNNSVFLDVIEVDFEYVKCGGERGHIGFPSF